MTVRFFDLLLGLPCPFLPRVVPSSVCAMCISAFKTAHVSSGSRCFPERLPPTRYLARSVPSIRTFLPSSSRPYFSLNLVPVGPLAPSSAPTMGSRCACFCLQSALRDRPILAHPLAALARGGSSLSVSRPPVSATRGHLLFWLRCTPHLLTRHCMA